MCRDGVAHDLIGVRTNDFVHETALIVYLAEVSADLAPVDGSHLGRNVIVIDPVVVIQVKADESRAEGLDDFVLVAHEVCVAGIKHEPVGIGG